MTLNQIKYFVAVCEFESLSRASRHLFITQPMLSHTITQLENEYNVSFFERKHHGLVLTEEGMYFYERAKAFLESYDNLDKDLKTLSERHNKVRIGVPPMIGSFLFPKIYNRYLKLNPDVKFEIWEEGSLAIRKRIQNRTLDLGFSILNNTEDQFEKLTLVETELVFCVSSSNPLSKKEVLTIEDIKEEHIMMMKEGFFQTQIINQMYKEIGAAPKINFVSSQLSVILEFVKMNTGGAFLIKELIEDTDDTIIGIPMKERLKLNIGLIWQKGVKLDYGADNFLSFVQIKSKV